jgi:DNA-directed RNA polymerase delta subunit
MNTNIRQIEFETLYSNRNCGFSFDEINNEINRRLSVARSVININPSLWYFYQSFLLGGQFRRAKSPV